MRRHGAGLRPQQIRAIPYDATRLRSSPACRGWAAVWRSALEGIERLPLTAGHTAREIPRPWIAHRQRPPDGERSLPDGFASPNADRHQPSDRTSKRLGSFRANGDPVCTGRPPRCQAQGVTSVTSVTALWGNGLRRRFLTRKRHLMRHSRQLEVSSLSRAMASPTQAGRVGDLLKYSSP